MTSAPSSVVWMFAFAACGGGSSAMQADDVPPPDDGPAAVDMAGEGACTPSLALTSTAYTEGSAIPNTFTCDNGNQSPPLAWVAACPAMSFAIVLTDKTNNLRHAAIYDIPAERTDLPQDVDKVFSPPDVPGAHNAKAFNGSTGYVGPCPPQGGGPHTYEFKITALDVATLPNVTQNSNAAAIETEVANHAIITTTLTGTYQR